MKKPYIIPEIEIEKFRFIDSLLTASGETTVNGAGGDIDIDDKEDWGFDE